MNDLLNDSSGVYRGKSQPPLPFPTRTKIHMMLLGHHPAGDPQPQRTTPMSRKCPRTCHTVCAWAWGGPCTARPAVPAPPPMLTQACELLQPHHMVSPHVRTCHLDELGGCFDPSGWPAYLQVQPPSMLIMAPVMDEECGPHRCRTCRQAPAWHETRQEAGSQQAQAGRP